MQETKPNNVQRGGRRAPGVEAAVRRWYVGGAAVEAGGFTGVHWSRLEEEGADSCRGEGKLSAGAVGVTEEGAATSVAAGRRWRKEDCCWPVKKLEGGGLLLWRLSLLRRPREALLGLLKLR